MQTKAHIKATNKWIAKKRDRITAIVAKDRKSELKAIAAAQNESLNTFIIKAIDERIERLKGDEKG
jgi:uncharacterized protein (DUF1778 family)